MTVSKAKTDAGSSKPKSLRLLCIASSKSKRWEAFANSIDEFAAGTGHSIEVELIEWLELIEADGDLQSVRSLNQKSFEDSPAIVRIESPDKDFEVIRGLLKAGVRETGDAGGLGRCHVEYELGKIVEPRLVYLGLKRILNRVKTSASEIEGLDLLADPDDIAEMFDKNRTSQRLSKSQISTPKIYQSSWDEKQFVGTSAATEALLAELSGIGFSSFYAKLAFGSASCGILIGRRSANSETEFLSTMIRIDDSFFNTRKLQTIAQNEVGPWIEFLVSQGVTIQKGINKSRIDGDNFDVRVVVIEGKVEFTIFRVSRHPVTGLHFGGYRGEWARCRAAIPNRAWLDAMDACVEAASLYDSHVVGVDLAFDRSYMNHYIIELNPFGDFFPGWVNEDGKSIHWVEIESYFDGDSRAHLIAR